MQDVVAKLAGPRLWEMSPGAARAVHRERFQMLNQSPVPMARVEDIFPTGSGGPVPMRVLTPRTASEGAPASNRMRLGSGYCGVDTSMAMAILCCTTT